MELTPMSYNYRRSVDWVIGAYDGAGIDFPNGFQKDAIQNAVGAKVGNSWKNWHCDISVVENDHGTFVVVEDSGTCGMTGNNTPVTEINKYIANGGELEPTERLARFTSMFSSGGNSGPGLFGAGKSVYAVASDTYTYYFDSLRSTDGLYIADANEAGLVGMTAYEGDEAEIFMLEKTGLSPKTTTGTRIVIAYPKQELVDSIVNGDIIPYIQESWWIIISRLDESASISVNGIPVEVPANIKNTRFRHELARPENYSTGYKVKHFGLYVFPDESNEWSGISYYRLGMKIGDVDIKDVPKKVAGKFWGYIEVDELWEKALSDIEDNAHFGVKKLKKNTTTYQNLKNYCNNKFDALMVEWGFKKDKENKDKRLKDELQQIAEELQGLFDNLGFEDLGRGPKKADFDVRWQNIHYPVEGTEEVTTNDIIDFSVRISSSYAVDKKFEYKLSVVAPATGNVISQIARDTIIIRSNTVEKIDFSHKVTKENSERFAENRIILTVKVVGNNKEKQKVLPYFYDIEKPDNSREIVNLSLYECIFPREGSRRVDFDEAITNVSYRIENKRNTPLSYRLNVRVHNASKKGCPKIKDIASIEGELAPFEEDTTPSIDEIVFDKSTYEQYLESGVLELRASLIAAQDDNEFEKGDRIKSYNYKIFLNEDEKNGKSDSFAIQSVDAPDDPRRSWYTPGNARMIHMNVGHAAYTNLSDYQEIQHEYLREQMMKQYALLYLGEGKFDMFAEPGENFIELSATEAVERVMNRIENIYYQSLR